MPTPLPWLTERILPDASTEVDEQAGIIKNVRVCGRYSKNNHGIPGVTEGTEYAASCHEHAKPLYEGVEVFCDHVVPGKGGPSRSVHDTFGRLQNVRPVQESEGTVTRADLHFLTSHPLAPRVVESVRRKLGVYGLSHHAKPASAKVVNGRYVVERLERIESVDLVNRPATSKNLMESQTVATKKLREVLGEWLPKSKRPKDQLEALKLLLEQDDLPAATMDAPVDVPDVESDTDPDEAIDDAFKQVFHAQVDALLNDSHTLAEFMSKVRDLYKTRAKLMGKADSGDSGEGGSGGDSAPKTESQQELRDLRSKVACLEAGIKEPSKSLIKALGLLETAEERAALLAELKPAAAVTPSKPKSSAPAPKPPAKTDANGKPVTESQEAPKSAKEFARSILG